MAGTSVGELLRKIAQGKPPAAVVLQGTDSYLRDLCRNALIEKFVPEGARDWALARVSVRAGGLQEAVNRAQMMPMMASQQVVLVEDVQAIEELGEKSRDAAVNMLEAYLDDPAPFTVVVLEAASLDGRLRLAKVLNKKALVVSLTMDEAQTAALAISTAKELGVAMDREAAELLVDAVVGAPARIRVEVEKLAVYAQKATRITFEDVEQLVVAARKHTVWQMADMLVAGQRDAAFEFLDTLIRDGESPAGLIGVLAFRYRQLIENRGVPPAGFGGRGAGGYGRAAAVPGPAPARRYSERELLEGLAALADADSLVKSGVKDQRGVLEFLITRLTGRAVGVEGR